MIYEVMMAVNDNSLRYIAVYNLDFSHTQENCNVNTNIML
jgi:hypothetical protein